MSILSFLHQGFAKTSLMYFLVLAAWGFLRFFTKKGVDKSYWGGLAVGEILVVVQSLIGFAMWIYGISPGRTIHILYGVLAPAVIPFVYVNTKGREDRAEVMAYGTATLFGAAFVMRAMFTGGF